MKREIPRLAQGAPAAATVADPARPQRRELRRQSVGVVVLQEGAGLDVEDLVTDEFEGLEKFHDAMALLESRRAMKIVFYPNGRP